MIFDIDPEDLNRKGDKDPNEAPFQTIPLRYLFRDLGVKWKG